MKAEDCVVWLRHRVGHLQRVVQLETLEGVEALRLLPNHIHDRIDELGTLGVVSLRDFVARARVSEHNVVWPEQLSKRSRTNAVHGSRVEVHESRAGM